MQDLSTDFLMVSFQAPKCLPRQFFKFVFVFPYKRLTTSFLNSFLFMRMVSYLAFSDGRVKKKILQSGIFFGARWKPAREIVSCNYRTQSRKCLRNESMDGGLADLIFFEFFIKIG